MAALRQLSLPKPVRVEEYLVGGFSACHFVFPDRSFDVQGIDFQASTDCIAFAESVREKYLRAASAGAGQKYESPSETDPERAKELREKILAEWGKKKFEPVEDDDDLPPIDIVNEPSANWDPVPVLTNPMTLDALFSFLVMGNAQAKSGDYPELKAFFDKVRAHFGKAAEEKLESQVVFGPLISSPPPYPLPTSFFGLPVVVVKEHVDDPFASLVQAVPEGSDSESAVAPRRGTRGGGVGSGP